MKKTLLNYKDWYDGKVYLETSATSFNPLKDNPIKVSLNQFAEKDRSKIQQMQKEIFLQEANEKFKLFKSVFNKRYIKSETKNLFLNREIHDIRLLIFSDTMHELKFKNRAFVIEQNDRFKIKTFINNHVVKGEPDYSFVHSPNFKYQIKHEVDTLIYARATFDYYNWLMNFKEKKDKQQSINDGKSKERIKAKLPVKVVALICFYTNVTVTEKNCKNIAEKYGYVNKTSGKGLLDDFYKLSPKNGRISLNDESKTKCRNRLKLIKLAATKLRGSAKEHAIKDSKTLENLIDEHVW